MADRKLTTYQFLYRYEGKPYIVDIPAYSFEEAQGRLKAMPMARYEGTLVARFPAWVGLWLPVLICRLLNWLRK